MPAGGHQTANVVVGIGPGCFGGVLGLLGGLQCDRGLHCVVFWQDCSVVGHRAALLQVLS